MAATQERHLSDQSEAVKTWSRDQNKLVQQVNTRVDQFLLEDLRDDLPTGLLFFFFSSVSFATRPSELI